MESSVARLVLIGSLAFAECGGGAIHQARTTLEAVSLGLVHTDELTARHYREAASVALEESTSFDEYQHKMASWDELIDAEQLARAALERAEDLIDLAERVSDDARSHENLDTALRCMGYAVSRIIGALHAVHVDVPTVLEEVFMILGSETGACGDA